LVLDVECDDTLMVETPSTNTGSSVAISDASMEYPSIEYPVPWIVHHTFVDVPFERSPLTEDFYKPREVKSAPVSGVEHAPSLLDANEVPTASEQAIMQGASQGEAPPVVLRLADALASELEPVSAGFPTIGSQGHYDGTCKPCAFNWRQEGCQNGFQCNFCHLCAPGEKKRRKNERRHLLSNMAMFGLRRFQVSRPTPYF